MTELPGGDYLQTGGLLPAPAEAGTSGHLCHAGAESVREKHQ